MTLAIVQVVAPEEYPMDELIARVSSLERRLRAIELPVWQITAAHYNWDLCAEGPCKCRIETGSLSCWRSTLTDLPAAQVVPKDVLKLQVFSIILV